MKKILVMIGALSVAPACASEVAKRKTPEEQATLAKLEAAVNNHFIPDISRIIIGYAGYPAIKGNIFLVPNGIAYLRNCDWMRTRLENMFGPVSLDEPLVEIEISSNKYNAWTCNQHPELPAYNGNHAIPSFFPIRVFSGKKELTDNEQEKTLLVTADDKPILLTLSNTKYKYCWTGAFEKAIERIARNQAANPYWGGGTNWLAVDQKEYEDEKKAAAEKAKDATSDAKENA